MIPPRTPKTNDEFVQLLSRAVRHGGSYLDDIPDLTKQIIKEERWLDRIMQSGEAIRFARSEFRQFVETDPPEGLGSTLGKLKLLCRDDVEALDLIDGVTVEGRGNPTGNNQYGGNDNNVIISTEEPEGTQKKRKSVEGNARQYALRRLRNQRPDLHELVLAKKLTPNAAMILAGFRDRTISVPENAEKAGRVIRRHFTREQIRGWIEGEES